MAAKDNVLRAVASNLGISTAQAEELIKKEFSSGASGNSLAEKIFIEFISNRDCTDTLDIEQDCINVNNQLLVQYSINLATLFERESTKWTK